MAYKRIALSGSTNGRGIKVVATATAGTTIHTAQASAVLVDVVTLYCYNSSVNMVRLTLEWGGVTAVNDNQQYDIPPNATVPIVPDQVIQNSLVIGAFAGTANVLAIFGFVNRES